MTAPGNRWIKWLICALLLITVLAVFWPALHCNFVYYDDQDYVTRNEDIQHGLNWQSIKWAFTSTHAVNWHPVTWMSHTVDCQLYGVEPLGHHLTNILLHMLNAVLLFLLLEHLTGALWASAWVAAVFALHPLRVESVVWVAERKDVLSTFFWMLTVGAYISYAQTVKSGLSNFKRYYALALVFYLLGLMSKPMLVTLPFVLLLLDYWPLGRLELGTQFSWRLVVEKIPFFVLSAASSLVTFLVQNHYKVVMPLTRFSLGLRLANVPVAYARYLGKNFWPRNLALFYPHQPLGLLEVAGAIALLVAVSVLAVRRRRAQPWLIVGWCWFLGLLVPTIGLVQVSSQAMADRYSYLSSVGLLIMLAWGVRDWVGARTIPRAAAALAGGGAVVACMVLTPAQIQHWRNSRSLFTWAAGVTDQNYVAYYNLGCDAMAQNQCLQAISYFNMALSREADSAPFADHSRAYNDLGYCYLHEGQISNAVANFDKALKLKPKYPEAFYNMGRAFMANKQPDVAIDCFQRALALDQKPVIWSALATAYAQAGNLAGAVAATQRARELALTQKNTALARLLESQLRTYQAGRGDSHP